MATVTTPADERFRAFAERLAAADMPGVATEIFRAHFEELVLGRSGMIAESDIAPVGELPDMTAVAADCVATGSAVLESCVVIKLNGGLGTGMGLEGAKSLVTAREGATFLELIVQQSRTQRTPLVLMNSFATQLESSRFLEQCRITDVLSFEQHRVPKIDQRDLSPASWPAAPQLEWCPPGHGDLYPALLSSGMLASMLRQGFRYAFVSNSDNLGATLDAGLLGYLVRNELPFLMEVADRTAADSKGGHLARSRTGALLLRESGQCPAADRPAFADAGRHRYFNTNNIWLDLQRLEQLLAQRRGVLDLPLICNRKPIDPRDQASTPVFQLETAMGAAISLFMDAAAIRVPRQRFAPVKSTSDLLLVRSDFYALEESGRLLPGAGTLPAIRLDQGIYGNLAEFEARFPFGPPLLRECTSLHIEGDVVFGRRVRLQGDVRIRNTSGAPLVLEDNALLTGEVHRG